MSRSGTTKQLILNLLDDSDFGWPGVIGPPQPPTQGLVQIRIADSTVAIDAILPIAWGIVALGLPNILRNVCHEECIDEGGMRLEWPPGSTGRHPGLVVDPLSRSQQYTKDNVGWRVLSPDAARVQNPESGLGQPGVLRPFHSALTDSASEHVVSEPQAVRRHRKPLAYVPRKTQLS